LDFLQKDETPFSKLLSDFNQGSIIIHTSEEWAQEPGASELIEHLKQQAAAFRSNNEEIQQQPTTSVPVQKSPKKRILSTFGLKKPRGKSPQKRIPLKARESTVCNTICWLIDSHSGYAEYCNHKAMHGLRVSWWGNSSDFGLRVSLFQCYVI
jgi:hypothetical protein